MFNNIHHLSHVKCCILIVHFVYIFVWAFCFTVDNKNVTVHAKKMPAQILANPPYFLSDREKEIVKILWEVLRYLWEILENCGRFGKVAEKIWGSYEIYTFGKFVGDIYRIIAGVVKLLSLWRRIQFKRGFTIEEFYILMKDLVWKRTR